MGGQAHKQNRHGGFPARQRHVRAVPAIGNGGFARAGRHGGVGQAQLHRLHYGQRRVHNPLQGHRPTAGDIHPVHLLFARLSLLRKQELQHDRRPVLCHKKGAGRT
ncbi:MAG: hypothetical protein L6V35_08150 [Alistipes putredinis]|nr:MAG: hypothetical protein L6V35_08150 [Alistipes putredinis]